MVTFFRHYNKSNRKKRKDHRISTTIANELLNKQDFESKNKQALRQTCSQLSEVEMSSTEDGEEYQQVQPNGKMLNPLSWADLNISRASKNSDLDELED